MNALGERIARLIEAQGPISVAQFMTLALHDPQGGVYAARVPIGRMGDFTTAPEISQMFGELLGLWCVEMWRRIGAPKPFALIELGPGRGTLMRDALRAARLDRDFAAAADVILVEASAPLRAIQAEALAPSGFQVRWTAHLNNAGFDKPFLLLANEFFDALPIRQYVHMARHWHERMVVVRDGKLAFAAAPVPAMGLSVPAERGDAEENAVYETAPAAIALTEEIAHGIARHGGGALIADYGYAKGGFGETLQAIAGHKFSGLLDAPGEADLSAHVDFASLADAARRGGAKVHGPVAQGPFLKALGIDARAAQLVQANSARAHEITAAVDRLTGRGAMGELFKMLALTESAAPAPPGF